MASTSRLLSTMITTTAAIHTRLQGTEDTCERPGQRRRVRASKQQQQRGVGRHAAPGRRLLLDPLRKRARSTEHSWQLSPATRLQWLHDASTALELATMRLELEEQQQYDKQQSDDASPSASASMTTMTTTQMQMQMQRQHPAMTVIDHPVLALDEERAASALVAAATSPTAATVAAAGRLSPLRSPSRVAVSVAAVAATALGNQVPSALSASQSPKRAPIVGTSTNEPLYARGKQRREVLQRAVRMPSRLAIEPLVSAEMRAKLSAHLEEKIRGDLWQNEVRSRLARPLSASTFCAREEQLRHPLSAPQFVAPMASAPMATPSDVVDSVPSLYPFSAEAHSCVRQIGACYATMRFRADVLAQVRCLAIAVRRFRRRFIPRCVQWHRTRKAAATRIQRCFRLHAQWRRTVLWPRVGALVRAYITEGLRRASAKVAVARCLETLYLARRARAREALWRQRVLTRWVAKTRVCLFVHCVWCVAWFRKKREHNLAVLMDEVTALEQIDAQTLSEFHVFFQTSMGAKALKKELKAWRQRVGASALANATTSTVGDTTASTSSEDDASIIRLRNCFRAFDLDGSGALDLDEFQLMLSYLRADGARGGKTNSKKSNASARAKLTPAQTRALFDDLDDDGNGRVTCAELETWWQRQHDPVQGTTSSSASTSFLAGGLDRLVLESRGLLFWLLGRKQTLERKFVKKMLVKRAADATKLVFVLEQTQREQSPPARRCRQCGRRFELERDVREHVQIGCAAPQLVVDAFVWRKWIREEEIRLLEDTAEADVAEEEADSE